jgi:hypothetical protein
MTEQAMLAVLPRLSHPWKTREWSDVPIPTDCAKGPGRSLVPSDDTLPHTYVSTLYSGLPATHHQRLDTRPSLKNEVVICREMRGTRHDHVK